MSDFAWLFDHSAPATVLAHSPERVHTRAEFCAAMAGAHAFLQRQPATEWVLWEADTWAFAVAFFALLSHGKRVILPANNTPNTLAALQSSGAAIFPAAQHFSLPTPPGTSAHTHTHTMPAPSLAALHQAEVVLYTSGSTGEPKRISRPFHRLLAEVHAQERCFGADLAAQGPVLASVSHQHIYGLLFKLLWPWAYGRAFINTQAVYPEHQAQLMHQHKNTVLVSSPALLKRWPHDIALPPLSAVFSSGGQLPSTARQQFEQQHGIVITEILGSSETGGIAWRRTDADWHALPGVQLRCDGTTQALAVCSPHTADEGWIETGDAVTLTSHGLHWLGRLDRLIKLEEKRISLDAIEHLLRQQTGVADAHVLMMSGKRESLAALIVPTATGQEIIERIGVGAWWQLLHRALAAAVDPLALPRRWRLLPALPHNAQGKINREFVQQLFATPPTLPDILAFEAHENALTLTLNIPASLQYFQGHFPVAPVLPGVAQLAWADQLGRVFLNVTGPCLRMEQVKFQHIVPPNSRITLHLEFQTDKQRLLFRFYAADKSFASGRMVMTTPAHHEAAQ